MASRRRTALATRARDSAWVSADPRLLREIVKWEAAQRASEHEIDSAIRRLGRPGLGPLRRATRHATAVPMAQTRWAARQVLSWRPGDVAPPREWLGWAFSPAQVTARTRQAAAELVRDYLAAAGTTGAEIARLLAAVDRVLPRELAAELRRRPVATTPMRAAHVRSILAAEFAGAPVNIEPVALATTPLTQTHLAELDDGRVAVVIVRRANAVQELVDDARIAAGLIAPLEQLVPALRQMHLSGVPELLARQALVGWDQRSVAVQTVELGIAVERAGLSNLAVARPIPGLVTERAAVFELPTGTVPLARANGLVRPATAAQALVGATVEVSLASGTVPVDLRAEHVLVQPDGTLLLAGGTTIGRLDLGVRRAALDGVVATISSDTAAQVEALQRTGLIPAHADLEALERELGAVLSFDPASFITGQLPDGRATARSALTVLARHGARPTPELMTVGAALLRLYAVVRDIAPEAEPVSLLLPLLPKLAGIGQRLA